MSADPSDLAAALAASGGSGDPAADIAQLPANQQGPGAVALGVGRGMIWNPAKQAYELAKRWGSNAIKSLTDPSADPMMPINDVDTFLGNARTGLDKAAAHPFDAIGNAASSLWNQASQGPEQAGEVAGSFISPGDLAKGLGLASDASKLDIWGGAKAASHDPARAAQAQAMKAAGASDQEIWDQTSKYNTPAEWGQEQPWHWIDDSKATILPGAQDKIKAGGATLGDVVHPDWDAFKSYPGLAELPVHFDSSLDPRATGYYEPTGERAGSMTIGPGGLDADTLRKTVVHETSHAVQQFEGMPQGSNLLNPHLHEAGLDAQSGNGALSAAEAAAIKQLGDKFHEATQYGPSTDPYRSGYFNSVGEVGARTAEAMLSAPQGTRPFEAHSLASAVPPQHQLAVGEKGRLYHPALKDSGLESSSLTGRFTPSGPDLARALQRFRNPE
jgi:hypothetical protein